MTFMKKISSAFSILIISVFFICCNADNTTGNDGNDGATDANNTNASKSETDSTRNSMQQDSSSQQAGGANITAPDFVMKAASGGIMEVTLAKMAQQKAKNQRV